MSTSPRIVRLRITDLIPHPLNPNKMPEGYQAKLRAHIERTGNYPPLIVRQHPTEPKKYQIIDGQHRWHALRALGHNLVTCAVWQVDDAQTKILLATLNRLEGTDDPYLKGTLLADLAQRFEISQLAEQLPLDAAAIRKFIQAADSPPTPSSPEPEAGMVHAITIFVTAADRSKIIDQLKTFHKDRGLALLTALSMAAAYRVVMSESDAPATPSPA